MSGEDVRNRARSSLGKDIMTDDKILLFKLHPCSSGLGDDALEEIADAAEIVRCEAGHVICQVDEPVSSVYLIVHGRLRLRLFDIQGRVAMQRFQSAGGQFGGLSAVLAELSSSHDLGGRSFL